MSDDVRPPKPRRGNETVYLDDGRVFVSNRSLKTPRKTFRLNRIEKLALRRDPLFFALPICLPLLAFGYGFFEYLYLGEIIAIFGGCTVVLFIASRVGILFVESKAVAEPAVISTIPKLRKIREAVEDAMENAEFEGGYQE